jgi:hypothetical protein
MQLPEHSMAPPSLPPAPVALPIPPKAAATPAPVTSPPVQPPAPSAPSSAVPQQQQPSTKRRPPQPLKAEEVARPTKAQLSSLNLDGPSPTDLVITLTVPTSTRRKDIQINLPHTSNNSSAFVNTIARLLGDTDGQRTCVGFAIPAPSIPSILSQFDDPKALHDLLTSRWTSTPSSESSPSPSQSSWLASIRTAATADQLAATLLSPPSDTPTTELHSSWKQLLNPYSSCLSSTKSPMGKRHVLRLKFNSVLVTQAVRFHLSRYSAAADDKSDISTLPAPIHSWALDAIRDGVPLSAIKVSSYFPRYETTRIVGWKCGPDHLTPSSTYDPNVDFGQLYGNTSRLMNFLHAAAPNCHPSPPTTQPDGTGIIDFIHEKRHRHELYRLLGCTSPAHGIHRPTKLKFYQRQIPAIQCCSLCGEPNHRAHECTVVPPPSTSSSSSPIAIDASMDVDEVEAYRNAAQGRAVCRDCYSPDHQQSCYTPASQQRCKICKVTGHTSFRCSQYRPTWVLLPTPKPEDCRPINLRPLTIIAQQQGRPPPSWSSIASGGSPFPPTHPSLNSPGYVPQAHDFPSLPNTGTPSAPPSLSTPSAQPPCNPMHSHTAQPPCTPMHSHAPISAETAALRAEVKELRSLLTERDSSLQQLIAQAVSAAISMALPLLLARLQDLSAISTPTPPPGIPVKPISWPPLATPAGSHLLQTTAYMEESKSNVQQPPVPTTSTTPPSPTTHYHYGGLNGVSADTTNTFNSCPHPNPGALPTPSLPSYSTATATNPQSHQ